MNNDCKINSLVLLFKSHIYRPGSYNVCFDAGIPVYLWPAASVLNRFLPL